MKHGKDEGAGEWIIAPGEITVSEYMLARHKEWAERVRSGDGGLPDAAMFAVEAGKMFEAFTHTIRNHNRLQRDADRAYEDGDLAG